MPFQKLNPASELYDKYKKNTTQYKDDLSNLRETVAAIITKKRLVSYMNTTKWLKLQSAVHQLSFLPAYIIKSITDKENNQNIIKGLEKLKKEAPWWLGDWSNFYEEGMPPLFNIEWIKVRPQLSISKGALIQPEIIDESDSFRVILNDHYIPHEEANHIFTIYGYK